MTIKVTLDRTAVREVPLRLAMPLVRKVGSQVERRSRTTVRVRTGAVRASIRSEMRTTRSKVVMTVSATHRRAMLEHQGAKAHPIDQRPGGPLLTFFWPKTGRVMYLPHVNHPGTKGSKFLTSPLVLHGLRNGFKVTLTIGGLSGTISS